MSRDLQRRVGRLETQDSDARPNGVLVLPTGMSMSDAAVDRLLAEHGAAGRGTVVVLPGNGRDEAP